MNDDSPLLWSIVSCVQKYIQGNSAREIHASTCRRQSGEEERRIGRRFYYNDGALLKRSWTNFLPIFLSILPPEYREHTSSSESGEG